MFVLIGIINAWPVAVVAGIILVYAIVKWIRETRDDIRQLPLEH
jgi:hypothetical protein